LSDTTDIFVSYPPKKGVTERTASEHRDFKKRIVTDARNVIGLN